MEILITVWVFFVVAATVVSNLMSVHEIDKPRKPITYPVWVFATIFQALHIFVVLYMWSQLYA